MRIKYHEISPSGYKAMKKLEAFVEQCHLDPFLKELVKIRASQINKCAFCLDMHIKDARAMGETEQRIDLLIAWREASCYSDPEKAALSWCETLTLLPEKGAPDDIFEELQLFFTPEQIVELTFLIVTINSWNRLSVGFRSEFGNYVSKKVRMKMV